MGEGFWMKEPDPEYLAALGAQRSELGLEGWVEDAAKRVGLKPVERWVSSVGDWDTYEDALLRGIEAFVAGSPGDPDGPRMLADQRAFHAAQVRWGRATMGFAVHLLQKPA